MIVSKWQGLRGGGSGRRGGVENGFRGEGGAKGGRGESKFDFLEKRA